VAENNCFLNFTVGGTLEAAVVLCIGWAGIDEVEAAQAIEDNLWDALRPHTSSAVRLDSIRIGSVSTGYLHLVNELGTGASAGAPPQVAMLVTKVVTGARNGRMFWPGVVESVVNEVGVFLTGTITTIQTALDTIGPGLTADNVDLQVCDKDGNVHSVTDLVLNSRVATQRRRLYN